MGRLGHCGGFVWLFLFWMRRCGFGMEAHTLGLYKGVPPSPGIACFSRFHGIYFCCLSSFQALNLKPDNAKALFRRGQAYFYLKNFDRAEADLKAAAKNEPTGRCGCFVLTVQMICNPLSNQCEPFRAALIEWVLLTG